MSADAADFALRGPLPEIPPGLLESPWTWSALLLLAATGWGTAALLRRKARPTDPGRTASRAIDAALTLPREASLAAIASALRRYLAEVEPTAPAGLSTAELEVRLGTLPTFLPARRPLIAALRATDAARFAGEDADPALVAAAAREAVSRAEAARGAFGRAP